MDHIIWQDREIRFDIPKNQMELIRGEKVSHTADQIEDAKGNPGESGQLSLTNLRLIWYCKTNTKINLSIGFDCIVTIDVKYMQSQSFGNQQTLHIKAKFKQSRFEFIFKSINGQPVKIFPLFQQINRSYESTKLFRDLKTRGAIIQDKNLILLPSENVINKYNNVLSVGQDQGTKGCLFVTNVRMVWFALNNESFNISIPWIQIKFIKKRDLKVGPALIIETLQASGGYIVGYQPENMEELLQEVQKLHKSYIENPILGVENIEDEPNQQLQDKMILHKEDDIEIIDHIYNERSAASYSTNYMSDEQKQEQQEIIFSQDLGLAIEKPINGTSIDDLWKIIKISK